MKKGIAVLIIIALAGGAIWYFSKKPERKTSIEYRKEGIALAKQGKYKEALKSLKKAVELDPDDSRAYYYMGSCYKNLDDMASAKKQYKKALELNPNYSPARICYAYCILKTAKNQAIGIEKAYREIGKIPKGDFDYPSIAYIAARIHAISNRPQLALQYLTHSINARPEFRENARADYDFESIRHLPEFKRLVY